ncbi:MAG TPA: 16S rRNA (adenine(1518)-N(6)/adenine(1519)-N(6))-dimethyltransferase RsmA [Elusimicrobiota bacterium]|nr:16S rRNA (adenine(1518)-N(6)/adenine(1519)-N(6))-dimethyltransferase RsmA [Elusimicrobiota bacterium]
MGARLDQHFLVSEDAAQRIVEAAGAAPRYLEIGPGRGILTGRLLQRAPVTAVELDGRLAAALPDRFPGAPLEILNEDFLQVDLARLPSPCVVVSNLPYSVGTPILQRLLDWPAWETAVLMFQKEVALRCLAEAGDKKYGLLSVSVALKAEAELVCEVPRGAFDPPPEVESAVVRLRRLPKPRLPEGLIEEEFFRVVRAAFSQRRKMAAKAIAAALQVERARVEKAFAETGIEPSARAETIPLEAFLALCLALRRGA